MRTESVITVIETLITNLYPSTCRWYPSLSLTLTLTIPYLSPSPAPRESLTLSLSVILSLSLSLSREKLHWRVAGQRILFCLQAGPASGATSGWVSVGWSPDDEMDNSDAVVANLAGSKRVQAYYLESRRRQSPSLGISLGANPTVVKDAGGLFVK